MQFDPRTIGRQGNSSLLGRIVLPRPVAWVSTVGEHGEPNLAPLSYYAAVCNNPPTICFSLSWLGQEKKKTLRNIEHTRDFVVNVVNEQLAPAMALTAKSYTSGPDKFQRAGVTAAPGVVVRAPRVAEAPVSMECRLTQTIEAGDDAGRCTLVLGEVVQFHVRDDLLQDGVIDVARLGAIAQLVGDLYCRSDSTFEAPRAK